MTSSLFTSQRPNLVLMLAFVGAVGIGPLGCGGRSGKAIVPEENQRESEERYGEQEMSMDALGQTSSEQATVRHQRDTEPVDRSDRED